VPLLCRDGIEAPGTRPTTREVESTGPGPDWGLIVPAARTNVYLGSCIDTLPAGGNGEQRRRILAVEELHVRDGAYQPRSVFPIGSGLPYVIHAAQQNYTVVIRKRRNQPLKRVRESDPQIREVITDLTIRRRLSVSTTRTWRSRLADAVDSPHYLAGGFEHRMPCS